MLFITECISLFPMLFCPVGICAFKGLQKTFCPCTCPETDTHVYTCRHTNIVCAYKGLSLGKRNSLHVYSDLGVQQRMASGSCIDRVGFSLQHLPHASQWHLEYGIKILAN